MEWNEGLGTLGTCAGVTLSLNLVVIWALDMEGESRLPLLFLRDVLGLETVVGESEGSSPSLLLGLDSFCCRRS